jgi:hypothetical protein
MWGPLQKQGFLCSFERSTLDEGLNLRVILLHEFIFLGKKPSGNCLNCILKINGYLKQYSKFVVAIHWS